MAWSPPFTFLSRVIPFGLAVLVNVQMTISAGDTSMLPTGLPSLQVADVWFQSSGTVSPAT